MRKFVATVTRYGTSSLTLWGLTQRKSLILQCVDSHLMRQRTLAAKPILDRDRSFTFLLAAHGPPPRSQAIDIAPVDAPIVYWSQSTHRQQIACQLFFTGRQM